MCRMSSPRAQIAGRVRAELARVGMSGRALAEALGVAHDGVTRRLSGAIPFRADELVAIGAVLEVDPGTFLSGIDPAESTEESDDEGRLPAFA